VRQIKKNRTFACENGGCSTKKASGHGAESENVVFIVDLRNWGATGLATPVMAQEEPITEQGYEREELGVNAYTAPLIARIFQQLDELMRFAFRATATRISKSESWQSRAKNSDLWRIGGQRIFDCRSREETAVDNLGF